MERAPKDWWREHFTVETLAGYGLGRKAAREAEAAARLLGLERGARVLDLCCGAGRHAIPLARRGCRVTGLDINPDLLAAARKATRRRGVRVELVCGDARRLAPGGALLMDLLNKEWLMRHFRSRLSRRGEGRVSRVLSSLDFDFERGRLETRRVLVMKGEGRRVTRLSIRLYTLTELTRLLDAAGLRLEGAWGGLDRRPYGFDTFRMVVVAKKRL